MTADELEKLRDAADEKKAKYNKARYKGLNSAIYITKEIDI